MKNRSASSNYFCPRSNFSGWRILIRLTTFSVAWSGDKVRTKATDDGEKLGRWTWCSFWSHHWFAVRGVSYQYLRCLVWSEWWFKYFQVATQHESRYTVKWNCSIPVSRNCHSQLWSLSRLLWTFVCASFSNSVSFNVTIWSHSTNTWRIDELWRFTRYFLSRALIRSEIKRQ